MGFESNRTQVRKPKTEETPKTPRKVEPVITDGERRLRREFSKLLAYRTDKWLFGLVPSSIVAALLDEQTFDEALAEYEGR